MNHEPSHLRTEPFFSEIRDLRKGEFAEILPGIILRAAPLYLCPLSGNESVLLDRRESGKDNSFPAITNTKLRFFVSLLWIRSKHLFFFRDVCGNSKVSSTFSRELREDHMPISTVVERFFSNRG